jgi:hypothetical protein
MRRKIQKTSAMLPESFHEFAPPLRRGIEPFDMLIVKLFESFCGIDSFGNEYEINTIHFFPVFFERSNFRDTRPDRGPVKRGKLGHVHVVKIQRHDIITCFFASAVPNSHGQTPHFLLAPARRQWTKDPAAPFDWQLR